MKRIVATGIALLSLSSVAEAHRLSGTATYYGGSDRLCGSRTASGARFNCGAMTAAHRTLPFGTVLTVQSGGRSIQVTVTDRGPFIGALLDLSSAARERARLPLHPSQRDRDGRANGIRWDCRCEPESSTRRRCVGHAAVLPADRGRHGSGGNVRILNGHGSCSAPPPSLQGTPVVGPILL
jgi:3D (Asp-Asp-Asp) domain-containing protein